MMFSKYYVMIVLIHLRYYQFFQRRDDCYEILTITVELSIIRALKGTLNIHQNVFQLFQRNYSSFNNRYVNEKYLNKWFYFYTFDIALQKRYRIVVLLLAEMV